jgi:hypothetical protein
MADGWPQKRIIADEYDRLLAELQATSQKSLFPTLPADFLRLKQDLWSSSVLPFTALIAPFQSIIRNSHSTDVITSLAISSIQSLILNAVLTNPSDADLICDDFISCSFQSTSEYNCVCVSHHIISSLRLLCTMNSLSPVSQAKVIEYLIGELTESRPAPFLVDTFLAIVRIVFGRNDSELQCKAINLLFPSADLSCHESAFVRGCSIQALSSVLRFQHLGTDVREMLVIVACTLFHQYLNGTPDIRDNFVLVMRMFFNIFADGYGDYILAFAKCFENFLGFLNDSSVPAGLHAICLEVLADFIQQDNWVPGLFANFSGREAFPDLFAGLARTLAAEPSLRGLEIALLFFQRIGKWTQTDFGLENATFVEFADFAQRFNAKPSSAIEGMDPASLAKLIFKCPGLSRESIGVFFGRNCAVSMDTLVHFIELFDFSALDLDSAVRVFLCSFQISGEGQVVDRILEAFARVYFACHPSTGIASAEALHILSYGWLMLHTSFHNNNVSKKASFEDFQRMLARQNAAEDFDAELLRTIYRSVKSAMIPFEDAQQPNTVSYWRLLLNLGIVTPEAAAAAEDALGASLFARFWEARAPALFAIADLRPDPPITPAFRRLVALAAVHGLTALVDVTVDKFCQLALEYLSQDSAADSLAFVAFVANEHGQCVCDGWRAYVDVLVTLFQLDLLPAEFLTFADVSEDGRATVLSHRLVATKRGFSLFRRKSGPDTEPLKLTRQTEVRESVMRANCHALPQFARRFGARSTAALLQAIVNASGHLEKTLDANGLYVAFCVLFATKILGEIGQCPSIYITYIERLMSLEAPFVQSMTINCLFGLVIGLFETLPSVACLFDCIEQRVSLVLIEKGLSLFMRRHFVAFAGTYRWRSVLRLLSIGIVTDSQFSLTVFRDLLVRAREAAAHFDECWRPVLEVLVALVRSGRTAHTIELQTMLLTATLTPAQWCDVFNAVLFPALARGLRESAGVAMVKVAAKAFLSALPVLEQSPRFESIWFRILSQALELGRAQGREEIPEILANALKVMSTSGAFSANRQKMWELTRLNIEAAFPDVIAAFLAEHA